MQDQGLLAEFKDKEYRDTYMESRVRGAIALQVQALRVQSALTQKEFAEKVGKTQSVISRLENTEYGRVTVQTLIDLAGAMDVALVVKFVSHEKFLEMLGPASLRPDTLKVETFEELMERRSRFDESGISEGIRKNISEGPVLWRGMRRLEGVSERSSLTFQGAHRQAYEKSSHLQSTMLSRAIS